MNYILNTCLIALMSIFHAPLYTMEKNKERHDTSVSLPLRYPAMPRLSTAVEAYDDQFENGAIGLPVGHRIPTNAQAAPLAFIIIKYCTLL